MSNTLRDPNEIPFFRGTSTAVAQANAYTDSQIATLGGVYEPLGASAAAVAAHEALLDPHPQYLTETEADALYDALGAATAAVGAHEAAGDPHPQYLTQPEGDARYDALGASSAAVAAHVALADPHTQYLTEVAAAAAYQPLDTELSAIAGLTSAADRGIYFTGAGTAATYTFTGFARTLLDDVDAAASRTTLGLGTIATQNANAVAITGGSITGATTINTTGASFIFANVSDSVATSGLTVGSRAQMIANVSGAAHTGGVYGGYFTGRSGALPTGFNVVGGCYFEGYHQGAAPITTFVGVRGQLINQTVNAAATVSSAISIWANAPFHATPLSGFTNCFGLRIESHYNASWATSSWGVYQLGTQDRNYYAGRTLMGSLTDDGVNMLQVTGAAKVTSGIRFNNTPSADATLLDYYSEGTWVPTVIGTATAGTASYTVQSARYTRIGNTVHFTVGVTWTGHTGTGNLRVTGLPFAALTGSLLDQLVVRHSGFTYVGEIGCNPAPGTTELAPFNQQSGGTPASLPIQAAGTLQISGTYFV